LFNNQIVPKRDQSQRDLQSIGVKLKSIEKLVSHAMAYEREASSKWKAKLNELANAYKAIEIPALRDQESGSLEDLIETAQGMDG